MRSALTHVDVRSLAVLPGALPSTPIRDERSPGPSYQLEGLERVPAIAAVVERSAERRAEGAVHRDPGRLAERAADVGRVARWGDPGGAEAGAARLGETVRRPGDLERELDADRPAEDAQLVGHRLPDRLEGRTGDEGWQQLHPDRLALAADVVDEAEVRDRDGRDLRVVDPAQDREDPRLRRIGRREQPEGEVAGRAHHVAPTSERRTSVNSAWSSRKALECCVRAVSGSRVAGSASRPSPIRKVLVSARQRASIADHGSARIPCRRSAVSPGSGASTVPASGPRSWSAPTRRLRGSPPAFASRSIHASRCMPW